MWQKLITKCVKFFITKCDVYYKLRQPIRQIIDVVLKNKHRKKKIVLNKIKKKQEELKSSVGHIASVVFYHNINKVITKREQIGWRHTTKRLMEWKGHRTKYKILETEQRKILLTTFHMFYQKKAYFII